MEQEILKLFTEEKQSLKKITEILHLTETEVKETLLANYLLVTPNISRDFVVKMQQATLYFINHKESATQVAKKFQITPTVFCKNLKKFGITAKNEHNAAKFDENIFDSIDTAEKAYWLGFIFADGTISSHKDGCKPRYEFELSVAIKDKEHLDKFNKFMQHQKDNVKCGEVNLGDKIFARARWVVGNKHLWETLNNLGCTPKKSLTLKFPNIPQALMPHFIRGYFDGDGSLGIYNGKPQCSCIGTIDILNTIAAQLPFEVHYHHDKRHSDSTYSIQLSSNKCIWFLDYIYKDCTVALNRKLQLYNNCRLLEKSNR